MTKLTTMTEDMLAIKCAEVMYEQDEATRFLGISLNSISPGEAIMSMEVKPWMLNGHQTCHGGFIFSLADSVFAFACNSRNQIVVGQSVSIDYVAPAKLGDILTASSLERKVGGKTGLYDVTVTNALGDDIAYFRGRSYRVKGQHIQDV